MSGTRKAAEGHSTRQAPKSGSGVSRFFLCCFCRTRSEARKKNYSEQGKQEPRKRIQLPKNAEDLRTPNSELGSFSKGSDARPRLSMTSKGRSSKSPKSPDGLEKIPLSIWANTGKNEPRRRSTLTTPDPHQLGQNQIRRSSLFQQAKPPLIKGTSLKEKAETPKQGNLLTVPGRPAVSHAQQEKSSRDRRNSSPHSRKRRDSKQSTLQVIDPTAKRKERAYSFVVPQQNNEGMQIYTQEGRHILFLLIVPEDLIEKRKKSIFAGLPAALPKPGVPIIQINKPNSRDNSEES